MAQTERIPKSDRSDTKPREQRVDLVDIGPPTRQSIGMAIAVFLATLLIHVGILLAMPERLIMVDASEWKDSHKAPFQQIHLMPDIPPPPEQPDQYVQATDAPENKPDDTTNFSSKDQQRSQKIESKDKTGDTPEVEKGEEEDTNALQTGMDTHKSTMEEVVQAAADDRTKPSDNDTQNPDPRDAQRKQEEQQAEGVREKQKEQPTPPAPSAIAEQNPESEGEGYAEILYPGKEMEMPEEAPKEREIPATITSKYVRMEQPKVDDSDASGIKPKPRPRLTLPGAMPTVVRKTASGLMAPTGFVAFDSKLSEYGDYLDRTMEVIVTKWYDLNRSGQVVVADSRVYVLVSFYITREGQVDDFRIMESTASQTAQWRCKDAILSNAPYFEWTPDMVRLLGDRTEVKIKFLYR